MPDGVSPRQPQSRSRVSRSTLIHCCVASASEDKVSAEHSGESVWRSAAEQPNTGALAGRFTELGIATEAIHRLFQTFYCQAHEFREEAVRHAERTP